MVIMLLLLVVGIVLGVLVQGMPDPLMMWVIGFVAVVGYLLPTIVAGLRGHPQAVAITALNLLLGWSFVGWAIAMVWSLTSFYTYE